MNDIRIERRSNVSIARTCSSFVREQQKNSRSHSFARNTQLKDALTNELHVISSFPEKNYVVSVTNKYSYLGQTATCVSLQLFKYWSRTRIIVEKSTHRQNFIAVTREKERKEKTFWYWIPTQQNCMVTWIKCRLFLRARFHSCLPSSLVNTFVRNDGSSYSSTSMRKKMRKILSRY